jgi:hypothetical protein
MLTNMTHSDSDYEQLSKLIVEFYKYNVLGEIIGTIIGLIVGTGIGIKFGAFLNY